MKQVAGSLRDSRDVCTKKFPKAWERSIADEGEVKISTLAEINEQLPMLNKQVSCYIREGAGDQPFKS